MDKYSYNNYDRKIKILELEVCVCERACVSSPLHWVRIS